MDEKMTIVGAGAMGHSIAIAAAWSGRDSVILGINQKDIEKAEQGIEKKISVLLENDLISHTDKQDMYNRISFTTSLERSVEEASFIIEAIPEDLSLKQDLFKTLDVLCLQDVILASTTSGLSPTQIAGKTKNPERTIVTHFWNPAHLVPLVEVVRGENTSNQTVERTIDLMKKMRKKPVEVKKDIPGFIVNRLQFALFREAQYILDQGAATKEDIDSAVMNSIARRLPETGIFLSADMGGLDVYEAISRYLFKELSAAEQSYEKMKGLIEQGAYGAKAGKGFYEWSEDDIYKVNKNREKCLIDFLKKDMNK